MVKSFLITQKQGVICEIIVSVQYAKLYIRLLKNGYSVLELLTRIKHYFQFAFEAKCGG